MLTECSDQPGLPVPHAAICTEANVPQVFFEVCFGECVAACPETGTSMKMEPAGNQQSMKGKQSFSFSGVGCFLDRCLN